MLASQFLSKSEDVTSFAKGSLHGPDTSANPVKRCKITILGRAPDLVIRYGPILPGKVLIDLTLSGIEFSMPL
jgi:hypothetical protein